MIVMITVIVIVIVNSNNNKHTSNNNNDNNKHDNNHNHRNVGCSSAGPRGPKRLAPEGLGPTEWAHSHLGFRV